jgi:predicted transcriptional regulator
MNGVPITFRGQIFYLTDQEIDSLLDQIKQRRTISDVQFSWMEGITKVLSEGVPKSNAEIAEEICLLGKDLSGYTNRHNIQSAVHSKICKMVKKGLVVSEGKGRKRKYKLTEGKQQLAQIFLQTLQKRKPNHNK